MNIFENQSFAEVCVAISDIPTDGLECDVEATIEIDGLAKARELHIFDTVVMCLNGISYLRAVEGMDFNVLGTPQVIFPAVIGSSGDQQCINISINDDMIVEGQQLIAVQFATGSEAPLGQIDFNRSTSLIIVLDNDGNIDDVGHEGCIINL